MTVLCVKVLNINKKSLKKKKSHNKIKDCILVIYLYNHFLININEIFIFFSTV